MEDGQILYPDETDESGLGEIGEDLSLEHLYEILKQSQQQNEFAAEALKEAQKLIAPTVQIANKAKADLEYRTKQMKDIIIKSLIDDGVQTELPGISITHYKEMQYNEEYAIVWAIYHNFEECLTLKKAEFNKIIDKMREVGNCPSFVTFKRTPTVAIVKNLTMAESKKETKGKTTKEKLMPDALKKGYVPDDTD